MVLINLCSILHRILDSPEWSLVTEKAICAGTQTSKGWPATINDCAKQCQGVADFFAFGTSEYGNSNCAGGCCKDETCRCYCYEGSAGSCSPTTHNGYHAYKYSSGSKTLVCYFRFAFYVYFIIVLSSHYHITNYIL